MYMNAHEDEVKTKISELEEEAEYWRRLSFDDLSSD
jgi:hypothetical protein